MLFRRCLDTIRVILTGTERRLSPKTSDGLLAASVALVQTDRCGPDMMEEGGGSAREGFDL